MKIFGQEIKARGSNKVHKQLDDLDALYDILQRMSIGQAAKLLGVPANSIRHRVHKYFLPEMIDNIQRQRRFHKNNVKDKIIKREDQ